MTVPLKRCQQLLGLLWIVSSGVLFSIMLLQTVGNHFGDQAEEAWNWLLPTVIPTLSLIVAVLFKTSEPHRKTVDRFLFRMCFSLSLAYLVTVLLIICMQPFQSTANSVLPADVLKHSNVFLAPFQGLVASSLGVFFGQIQVENSDESRTRSVSA